MEMKGNQNVQIKSAIQDTRDLLNLSEKPKGAIGYHSDIVFREDCSKYPKILDVIAKDINFHGKQGLALKRHREILQENDTNPSFGKFFCLIQRTKNYCLESADA